jgi:membrane fusion protein (multidrug efflux system)
MPPEAPPPQNRSSIVKFSLFWVLLAGVAAVVVFQGLATRNAQSDQITKWTEAEAVPTVSVIKPSPASKADGLSLPGRLDAYFRAPLYARVSGYVTKWTADIGAKVKAGQLLAEIEAPDLDQQLLQAESQLANAKASASLADVTSQRYQALLPSSFVSRQSADEKSTDFASKEAQVKALQANLERLRALTGFKQILAPFDGVLIARNTDVGALTNSNSTSGAPLFVVADVHKLRLYVSVPQSYVPSIKIGSTADFTVPEYPSRSFTATVAATSQAVEAASGTTQIQLEVDNGKGELLAGGYANVRFRMPKNDEVLQIPASALIYDSKGLSVATVDAGNHVVVKRIKIGRDFGKVLEVVAGISPNDAVIDSPPDGILPGDSVNVAGSGQTNDDSKVASKTKDGSKS